MNFSDYTKKDFQNDVKNNNNDSIKDTYEEIKNMNTDQLTERLFNIVKKQKEEGSFNYEMLESSIESLKPFIKEENYLQLKELLKSLK